MARKKSRDSQTSKGQRRNVSKWSRKAAKKDTTPIERVNNQMAAFQKGKNVVLTIPNPIKSETKMPFIRVSAKEHWRHTGKFSMKDRG